MLTNARSSCAPDPFGVVVSSAARYGSDRQRLRRSQMLATSRRILAEDSYDGFTIRRMAEACDVSAQTIHNCFGSRTELLRDTLNQFTSLMYEAARADSTAPTFLLSLTENYCAVACDHADFARQMMAAAFSSRRPLLAELRAHGHELRRQWLSEVAEADCFGDGVDLAMLGNQVCQVQSCLMFEWSVGQRTIEDVHPELVTAVYRMLRGAIRPEHGPELDDWMANRLLP